LTSGEHPSHAAPLLTDLEYTGTTGACQRILNGTYMCPLGVDACTRDFITSLQVTSPIGADDRISNSITSKDYKE